MCLFRCVEPEIYHQTAGDDGEGCGYPESDTPAWTCGDMQREDFKEGQEEQEIDGPAGWTDRVVVWHRVEV